MAFILIISFCLTGLFAVIYVNFFRQRILVLDTSRLVEQAPEKPDTGFQFQIIAVYPANELNHNAETIPWADVYVCTSFSKEDSLSGHTKFMVLDINTKSALKDIKYLDDYSVALKKETFKKCRVKIPPGIVNDIKSYKYRLFDVKLEYSVID